MITQKKTEEVKEYANLLMNIDLSEIQQLLGHKMTGGTYYYLTHSKFYLENKTRIDEEVKRIAAETLQNDVI